MNSKDKKDGRNNCKFVISLEDDV